MRWCRLLSVFAIAAWLCLPTIAWAQDTASTPNAGSPLAAPRLEIPIPGVNFSRTISEDGEASTLLTDYIVGVYRYAIGIAGLVAAVFIVIGGFQYILAGGDAARISKAKERITNALTGMIIALGSYAILFAINPNLVAFQGLKFINVTAEIAEFDRALSVTEADTAMSDGYGGGTGEDPSTSTADPPLGSMTPALSNCPLRLPIGKYNAVIEREICAKTQNDAKPKRCTSDADCPGDVCAGRVAFYKQIRTSGAVTATTPRERVQQIARIADACNVNLGSCGSFAGTVTALAGVGKTSCLDGLASGNCGDFGKGKQMFGLTGQQVGLLKGWNCAIDQKAYPNSLRQNCVNESKAAIKIVTDLLYREVQSGALPKDWPDSWAKQLRPGDRIHVYNGNTDLTGSHAAIVMGWLNSNEIEVIQGGNGGKGAEYKRARGGKMCITKACGERMVPLTKGWSPGS